MNSKKLKILTIFGTRPEVIKLFPVIREIREHRQLKNVIVSTSQHREMIDDLLQLFSIKPDVDLNIIQKNQSLVDISTRALTGLNPILNKHKPDIVLVQGDTTTAFIGALAAFYNRIPVGHVEAGLRSFDRSHPYPEEVNRKMISALCELNFAPTMQNAEHILREGADSTSIYITGNTVIDALEHMKKQNGNTLARYLPKDALDARRMILVTAHRRENWGRPLKNLCSALLEIADRFEDVHIVFPVHLNPNVREIVFGYLGLHDRIHLLSPLSYQPFIEAMNKAYMIVTDSGGIQEEGPSFHKPILVFRKVTERPEGLLTGAVKLLGLERDSAVREMSRLLNDSSFYRTMSTAVNPYGDGLAAKRIVQAIFHYYGYAERPKDFDWSMQSNKRSAKCKLQEVQLPNPQPLPQLN